MKTVGPDFYERIGMAFETPNLYSKFTARENLAFFGSLYAGPLENAEALLAKVGLEKYGRMRVGEFSKGMKVRLNLIRALRNRPEILFLDEPTSGLDPGNAKVVKDLILEKRALGTTVFLSTHNMHVASEICDRVAFVVDGRISLIDSPRALMLASGRKKLRIEFLENGLLQSREFALQGIGGDEEFLALLREKEVETIHTQEASLEDVFIRTTGRSLT